MPVMQVTTFSFSNNMQLVFDGEPRIIEALEKLSLSLGAIPSEETQHLFTFNMSEDKNYQVSIALEKIWNCLNSSSPFETHIVCGKESFIIEGDTVSLKAILALIQTFGKDIFAETIEFCEEERIKFEVLKELLNKLELFY